MEMKRQMAVRVKELEQKYGRVPHLVVVLVGEDPGLSLIHISCAGSFFLACVLPFFYF